MKTRRGRPPKYEALVYGLPVGQAIDVWSGKSDRYAVKLTWELNTGRISLPEGEYEADRAWDDYDQSWIVRVRRVA